MHYHLHNMPAFRYGTMFLERFAEGNRFPVLNDLHVLTGLIMCRTDLYELPKSRQYGLWKVFGMIHACRVYTPHFKLTVK